MTHENFLTYFVAAFAGLAVLVLILLASLYVHGGRDQKRSVTSTIHFAYYLVCAGIIGFALYQTVIQSLQ